MGRVRPPLGPQNNPPSGPQNNPPSGPQNDPPSGPHNDPLTLTVPRLPLTMLERDQHRAWHVRREQASWHTGHG